MVKYDDASTLAKLAMVCTNFGMMLVLFSFQKLLDMYNVAQSTRDPGHLAMFIIAFFFYFMSAVIITFMCSCEEIYEGVVIKVIYVVCAFIAGVFLVVGLGLFGQYDKKTGDRLYQPSPYALLVGVHALVLIFIGSAFGAVSMIKK